MVTSELIGFEQRVPHLHGFTDARADPGEMFLGGKDLLGDTFTNNIIQNTLCHLAQHWSISDLQSKQSQSMLSSISQAFA